MDSEPSGSLVEKSRGGPGLLLLFVVCMWMVVDFRIFVRMLKTEVLFLELTVAVREM